MSKKKLQSDKTIRDKRKAKEARRQKRKERTWAERAKAAPWPGQILPPKPKATQGPSLAEILTGPVPGIPLDRPALESSGLTALAVMAAWADSLKSRKSV